VGSGLGIIQLLYNHYCNLPIITPPQKVGYGCYTASYSEGTSPSVTKTGNFLIDRERAGEPLSSYLIGLNHGLTTLRTRNVSGDMVGVIGFDQSAVVDKRRLSLTDPRDEVLDSWIEMSDVGATTPESLRKRFEDHVFFPRPDATSNYPQALREALAMLMEAPNASSAENMVVMLSDGFTFCTSDGACMGDEDGYYASFNETRDIVLQEFVGSNVKFHFVMINDSVFPHTLLRKSVQNPDKCMDDMEARLGSPPTLFVDPDTHGVSLLDGLTKGNEYFYHPNAFYGLVRETNGVWGPVRPCCINPATGICGDMSQTMHSACSVRPVKRAN
jgi:hypothetical protein